MGEYSEAFVAFDVAKKKHAVAIAEGGRNGEVRFVGEVENSPAAIARTIKKLGKKYDRLHVCFDGAGRRGLSGHARRFVPGRSDLRGRDWGCASLRYAAAVDGLSRPRPGGAFDR